MTTTMISEKLAIICLGLLLILAFGLIDAIPVKPPKEVATEFIILHDNDMHARFEQTSANSGKCTEELAKSNKCYGGFARVAHVVRKYREEAKTGGIPVLYLNAGDTAKGTAWYYLFKEEIAAAFMNKLQPDAASLGNHEFDTGISGLVTYVNKVEFPIVATNLEVSAAPELWRLKNLYNSTVLEVNGTKIGVIGYITPETMKLTMGKDKIFVDEIEAINKEAAMLKAEGINIIIALGHSGYLRDQEIAAMCSDVDLVIGGHTNTFLYNGSPPDSERIEGPYPTVVNQTSGKQVPVLQAYAFTKYLGKLNVQFDKEGNLIKFDGLPILLNSEVPREEDVLELLEVYRPNVTELESNVVGYSMVHLEGRSEVCRTRECNLGNLLTDAFVHARVLEDMGGPYWTDAAIAFASGGGIRNSIEKSSDGSILAADVVSVQPFGNYLYVTKISGQTLLGALEHSATMHERDSNGGFLQMSGVQVSYDFNKPSGSRVVSANVRCAACNIPIYEPLDLNKQYNVIVPNFLLQNGDGHKFLEDNGSKPDRMNYKEVDALTKYLQMHNTVYPAVENRIRIIYKTTDGDQ